NLCCIAHDQCYEHHSTEKDSREDCDNKFCNCLQDGQDKTKQYSCALALNKFCNLVITAGGSDYDKATPIDYNTDPKFKDFVDSRPLGMDMLRLVMACRFTRGTLVIYTPGTVGMAVHCHNQAVHCLEGAHERSKRGALAVENSYQDCRATIQDCLNRIVDNGVEPECTNLARDMSKSANTYVKLLSDVHGQSAIDVYEVISGRVLSKCPHS
ncbi:hypothetical protein PFISCL1PPCAC_23390, partial [Pristionchus fissidentatus]